MDLGRRSAAVVSWRVLISSLGCFEVWSSGSQQRQSTHRAMAKLRL